MIDLVAQFFDAPRPPSPDLRRNIMQHANAVRLHRFRDAERKAGAVNRHQQSGLARQDIGFSLRQATLQLADAGQYFQQAHQCQFAVWEQAWHALFGHAFAANASEGQIRPQLAQGRNQPRAEHIARSLSGDDIDQRHTKLAGRGWAKGALGQSR